MRDIHDLIAVTPAPEVVWLVTSTETLYFLARRWSTCTTETSKACATCEAPPMMGENAVPKESITISFKFFSAGSAQ